VLDLFLTLVDFGEKLFESGVAEYGGSSPG
jgi:hypothetical protein